MHLSPERHYFFCDFETTGTNPNLDLPIEVGLVMTNSKLETLDCIEAMIAHASLLDGIFRSGNQWTGRGLHAFKYHRIEAAEYLVRAQQPACVVSAIMDWMEHAGTLKLPKKPVLISDNIWFEFTFMRQVFDAARTEWPFHYCGWDTSLLFAMSGTEDPPSELKTHRALQDAIDLLAAVRRCKAKLELPMAVQE